MQDETDTLRSQGVNPESIFTNLYPAIYALSHRDGGYARMSDFCVALAAAQLGSLAGKDVLDVGAGYGTTLMSIAAWNPAYVRSVDNSPAMVKYMRTILETDVDLDWWLRSQGAFEVLSPLSFYEPLLQHFKTMREVLRGSIFGQRGSGFEIDEIDSLNLGMSLSGYDAVIGNNFFHWPVNQTLDKMTRGSNASRQELIPQAVALAVGPLRKSVNPDGVIVLMEPADFISLDDDPELDRYIEENAMQAHPCFKRVQGIANEILARDYDITRAAAKRTTLFKRSELPAMMEASGLRLIGLHHVEAAYVNDPLEVYLSRLFMQISNVKVPFAAKLLILREVYDRLKGNLTAEELRPTRPHWFFLVLKPI